MGWTPRTGGSYILHFSVFLVFFLTFCWPYLIWHGHDADGGWTWDASSWAASCIWWMAAPSVFYGVRWLVRFHRSRRIDRLTRFKVPEQWKRDEEELERLRRGNTRGTSVTEHEG